MLVVDQLAQFIIERPLITRPGQYAHEKHLASPAAVKYAAQLSEALTNLLNDQPAETRLDFLRRMPSYDGLLAMAYDSYRYERKREAQRDRGNRSPKTSYRVGSEIWDTVKRQMPGLAVPAAFTAVRLPRTVDGFVEDILRERANLADNAPTLWIWLRHELGLAKPAMRRESDPRADFYLVPIGEHEESLSYMQFQKILTRARKPQKTLSQLTGTRG